MVTPEDLNSRQKRALLDYLRAQWGADEFAKFFDRLGEDGIVDEFFYTTPRYARTDILNRIDPYWAESPSERLREVDSKIYLPNLSLRETTIQIPEDNEGRRLGGTSSSIPWQFRLISLGNGLEAPLLTVLLLGFWAWKLTGCFVHHIPGWTSR